MAKATYLIASPKGNCYAIKPGRGEISPRPFFEIKGEIP